MMVNLNRAISIMTTLRPDTDQLSDQSVRPESAVVHLRWDVRSQTSALN